MIKIFASLLSKLPLWLSKYPYYWLRRKPWKRKAAFLYNKDYAHAYMSETKDLDAYKDYLGWCEDKGFTHVLHSFINEADGARHIMPWKDSGRWFVGDISDDYWEQWDDKVKALMARGMNLTLILLLDDIPTVKKYLKSNRKLLWETLIKPVVERYWFIIDGAFLAIEPEESWDYIVPALRDCAIELKKRSHIKYIGGHGTPGSSRILDAVPECDTYFAQLCSPHSIPTISRLESMCRSQMARRPNHKFVASEYDITGQSGLGDKLLERFKDNDRFGGYDNG